MAQAPAEIKHLLNFVLSLLRDFGMDDYYLELSTRETEGDKKDKFIGSDEEWEVATDTIHWSLELFNIVQRDPALGPPHYAEMLAMYDAEDAGSGMAILPFHFGLSRSSKLTSAG